MEALPARGGPGPPSSSAAAFDAAFQHHKTRRDSEADARGDHQRRKGTPAPAAADDDAVSSLYQQWSGDGGAANDLGMEAPGFGSYCGFEVRVRAGAAPRRGGGRQRALPCARPPAGGRGSVQQLPRRRLTPRTPTRSRPADRGPGCRVVRSRGRAAGLLGRPRCRSLDGRRAAGQPGRRHAVAGPGRRATMAGAPQEEQRGGGVGRHGGPYGCGP